MSLFTTNTWRYEQNLKDSSAVYATRVRLAGPSGHQPAVGIFTHGPRLILTPEDALRLANQIADALAHTKQEAN